jgi:lipopolysaccharide/colanic/teichoic acid biosynthesis glycosyltransferase
MIYNVAKRVFDIFASVAGLILFSPFIVVISAVIKLYDRGPVFYRAKRVGLDGKIFKMFKFRTMVLNADKIGPSSVSSSDNRITNPGRVLRKYKMDEMPQLINVIRGEMSIVGPRPEEKKFTDLYSDEEKVILTLKPGITDWASIWDSNEAELLANSADADKTYMDLIRPEKIRLQIKYVRNRNFFIDLRIIFLTFKKMIWGDKTIFGN